jgi:hypothetical protein
MRINAEQFCMQRKPGFTHPSLMWVEVYKGPCESYRIQGSVWILTISKEQMIMLSTATGPIRITKVPE